MKENMDGDIIRKSGQAELSSLHATLHIDLLYNLTKYHLNISNGCGVMLWQWNLNTCPNIRPTFIILITRVFCWKTWLIIHWGGVGNAYEALFLPNRETFVFSRWLAYSVCYTEPIVVNLHKHYFWNHWIIKVGGVNQHEPGKLHVYSKLYFFLNLMAVI